MKPLVSIVVPVYNAEHYLVRCIDSILAQTFTDIEVIIIDDGSTDASRLIASQYRDNDPRVILLVQKNSGVSVARNRGIEASTGKYVQFVDADDTLDPDMTATLLHYIQDADIAICGYRRITAANNRVDVSWSAAETYSYQDLSSIFGKLYTVGLVNSIWNKLYVGGLIRQHNLKFDGDIKLGEDLLFNLSYLKCCRSIQITPEVLYNYVYSNPSSLSRTLGNEIFFNQQMLFKEIRFFCYTVHAETDFVEWSYVNMLVSVLGYYCERDTYARSKAFVEEIVSDAVVRTRLRYFTQCIQNKLVGQLIKHKLVGCIWGYFSVKSFIRPFLGPIRMAKS